MKRGTERFLEPILYPFISPIINSFWGNKAVQNTTTGDQQVSKETNGTCKTESNKETTSNGSAIAADKKTD
ncbi:hypothetical protein OJAV_G00121400 [Oryzias javanicus]|uniref:Uncharacterized protein n=1 Tax=Oryzias javanicus TaxID=123683 RepID=A0A3S2PNS5_ORYJA|nr:hypothetical protein OJAV_G00121400 [Oryzias javanicus]